MDRGASTLDRCHRLPQPAQRLALEACVQAVEEATQRVAQLGHCFEQEITHWHWLPVVNALQACRGIDLIHAVRIVAELGDLSRFSHPRQLMNFLGLIPRENFSGERRRQGAITKAGNSSARRALVEAAWAYQFTAKVSGLIARRQAKAEVCARHCVEGAGTAVQPISQSRCARCGSQQDRGSDRARAGRIRVGHRATREAGVMMKDD